MSDRATDAGQNIAPPSRSLVDIVRALELSEGELFHQVKRLEDNVTPRTEDEAAHLTDMREGYRSAARYVGILKRYNEGRLRRRGIDYAPDSLHDDDAINDSGIAMPYATDDGAPV